MRVKKLQLRLREMDLLIGCEGELYVLVCFV